VSRRLLVRADGNARIGLGHVLRCAAVADELARTGVATTFLSRPLPPRSADYLRARGHMLRPLDLPQDASETEDAATTAIVAKDIGADCVLLDHYGLWQDWTHVLRFLPLAAFDDLATGTRDVGLLIDPAPGRTATDYTGLVPCGARVLVGPAYAALRPEFALARTPAAKATDGPCRVLISMGGTDPTGASLIALDALDARSDIALTVILGSASAYLEATRARVARMQTPTRLLLDRGDMAALLTESDLVIGAGGTSALERCVLARPSVVVVLAENQRQNAHALAQAGAATMVATPTPENIRKAALSLIQNAPARTAMGQAAARLCDGLGAPRVAAALLSLGSDIALRPAGSGDMEPVHGLQSEHGARRFARSPEIPSLKDHARWFTARLARQAENPFYIVSDASGAPLGFVRLDRTGAAVWEVSILIAQSAQGRGIARRALGLLRMTHPRRHITAYVHPENTASQRLFESAGYHRTAEDRFASPGWAEIEQRHRHAD